MIDTTMDIHIAPSTGSGPTELAAFDSALHAAGVSNYNLLRLSSVVPPKSNIVVHKKDEAIPSEYMPGEWGDRLYVVMAEMRADRPNMEAWAGIGWVQDKESGKGLFVEHEGHSEAAVRLDITQSLEALTATRNVDFGEINMVVSGTVCKHLPVCAMVVAVYESEGWKRA